MNVQVLPPNLIHSGDHRVTVSKEDENATGPIRVIEIDQVDACTCCGTHVKNTSELQVIFFFFFKEEE